MYRLFHNRVYLVSEAWKIIHKVGSKTVLMQLFYYDQKDSVCWWRLAPLRGGVEVRILILVILLFITNALSDTGSNVPMFQFLSDTGSNVPMLGDTGSMALPN